jgi:signal transduction histidine kinase
MYISEQFILMERADTRRRAELGEVDLVAILHQAADDLWEDARRLPARVERRCRLDGAWIRGDARLLHRVLLNLGWNALHHGPPQGVVTLSLEETGGAYRFAVHDQGKGFPAGGFASLSEDWRQSDESASGHGLGLALVRKVAQQHGAALSTEHPPHGGFAVIFAFPS